MYRHRVACHSTYERERESERGGDIFSQKCLKSHELQATNTILEKQIWFPVLFDPKKGKENRNGVTPEKGTCIVIVRFHPKAQNGKGLALPRCSRLVSAIQPGRIVWETQGAFGWVCCREALENTWCALAVFVFLLYFGAGERGDGVLLERPRLRGFDVYHVFLWSF